MRPRQISWPEPWELRRSSPLSVALAALAKSISERLPARGSTQGARLGGIGIRRFAVAESLQLHDARQQRFARLGETRSVQLAQCRFAALLRGAVLTPTAIFGAHISDRQRQSAHDDRDHQNVKTHSNDPSAKARRTLP